MASQTNARVSAYLDLDTRRALRVHCAREGIRISDLVADLIRAHLHREILDQPLDRG